MAELFLSENLWRMIRRVYRKKRFRFEDARNMTRQDQKQFDWLVKQGFFAALGDGWYEATERGRNAADMGAYQWEPTGSTTSAKSG
jgi:hypothetical protein